MNLKTNRKNRAGKIAGIAAIVGVALFVMKHFVKDFLPYYYTAAIGWLGVIGSGLVFMYLMYSYLKQKDVNDNRS